MKKKIYRSARLFPQTLAEVVKTATKPMLDERGKLYGALLRDWATIVGEQRAKVTKPSRIQYYSKQEGATLYVDTTPAAAPELSYATEQMMEQCARYFGYRAITRIIFNPVHGLFAAESPAQEKPAEAVKPLTLPDNLPRELKEIFTRMTNNLKGSTDDPSRRKP